jgi:hypothetical protein
LRTHAGTHGDFDALTVGTETGLLVNETRKAVTTLTRGKESKIGLSADKAGHASAPVVNRDELQHEVETGEGENYQNKPSHHLATSRP